ncbi:MULTISPECIES: NUDIX hydrolase [unclassified Caulobacter]|uniref:NUDIX hydrolase n=1 Tax=unclassified Caulobacter TaxID=2648921 RepID=UPI000D3BE42B|nr:MULTISPECIES: NUDIX domain-containing protein [unclassified Caulobacter]PTS87563.1 NUDIX hydrolase [Caulobacter sp. HMWF009]PTT08204.1 NUDIX hydrolase [Caulobacter sp. HMWF025]
MAEISTGRILPAATVLLLRDAPAFEVLMVKRHHQIDFAAGALVFPGGKSHGGDEDPRWRDMATGWDAVGEDGAALRIAAIREAYEEAGVLLARRPDGEFYAGEAAVEVRAAVAEDRVSFMEVIADLGLKLDLAALTIFARWITPRMMPKRFDTWFYAAHAPGAQQAICDGHEAVDAEWIAPGQALDLAAAGARKVIFPTRMNLQLLAESQNPADAIARARQRPLVTVEPWVEGQGLRIQPEAGYGDVIEPLSAL